MHHDRPRFPLRIASPRFSVVSFLRTEMASQRLSPFSVTRRRLLFKWRALKSHLRRSIFPSEGTILQSRTLFSPKWGAFTPGSRLRGCFLELKVGDLGVEDLVSAPFSFSPAALSAENTKCRSAVIWRRRHRDERGGPGLLGCLAPFQFSFRKK